MANQITATGLQTKTLSEIIAELQTAWKSIYGTDINLGVQTPDGNLINLIGQMSVDNLELARQVYAARDPDQAAGVGLDTLCSINGVKRKAGTYTLIPVQIVLNWVESIFHLKGLDLYTADECFTISDGVGNKYYLTESWDGEGGVTLNFVFRSAEKGPSDPALNTVTTVVSTMPGIQLVTNNAAALIIGSYQETDASLRLRRQVSVSIPSSGWYEGVIAAILEAGALDARIYENVTSVTDVRDIPSHSTWIIIDDPDLTSSVPETITATALKYATIIYNHKNAGCGQKTPAGSGFTVPVDQVDGTSVDIKFDIPVTENLYIKIDAAPLPGKPAVDVAYVKSLIYNYFQNGAGRYTIGEPADASSVTAYLKSALPDVYFSNEGVCLIVDGTYQPIVFTTTGQHRWTLGASSTAGHIIVNSS